MNYTKRRVALSLDTIIFTAEFDFYKKQAMRRFLKNLLQNHSKEKRIKIYVKFPKPFL